MGGHLQTLFINWQTQSVSTNNKSPKDSTALVTANLHHIVPIKKCAQLTWTAPSTHPCRCTPSGRVATCFSADRIIHCTCGDSRARGFLPPNLIVLDRRPDSDQFRTLTVASSDICVAPVRCGRQGDVISTVAGVRSPPILTLTSRLYRNPLNNSC